MAVYIKGILVALKGLPITLGVSLFAVVIGAVVGMILALMKLSKSGILKAISSVIIELIRSTPMLVQALIFAFGIPMLLKSHGVEFNWSDLIVPAMIVCALNSAAYIAEIFRGGIQAVDKGQVEAGLSLGMTKWQINRLIVFPQAFRISIPALGNELVTMIKETSVLSYVGVTEVLRSATLWNASSFETFPAYVGAAIVYLAVCYPLSLLIRRLENKLDDEGRDTTEKAEEKRKMSELLYESRNNGRGLR